MNFVKWIPVCVFFVIVLSACHAKPRATSERIESKAGNQGDEQNVDRDAGQDPKPIVQNIDGDTLNRRSGGLLPVFFDYDRYDIREDQVAVLQDDANVLRNRLHLQVLIAGHCDERGTEEYNLALGDRRAAVTRAFLTDLGISAGRMRTISFGESHPAAFGHDETAWSKNRRAELAEK